jgi:hypothetical protein
MPRAILPQSPPVMPATHAAVELDGTTLRFAEVDPDSRALARLGRIMLDFDVRAALDGHRDERAAHVVSPAGWSATVSAAGWAP